MKKISLTILLLCLVAVSGLAQEQTGRIEGIVTNPDGAVVVGAEVIVSSDALIQPFTQVTRDNGRFRFSLLPIGVYRIEVKSDQYSSYEQTGIDIQIGQTVSLNIVLKPGEFEEVVTVTGEAPLIDTKSTQIGEVLDNEVLKSLPVPRFPSNLLESAAGSVGTTAMGAGSSSSNAFQLDGVDVSDPETGGVWVFVNMESIDEMQLLPISGSTADVGGFTGSAINMVTKSGGNEFSGGLTYFYFDEDFITWNTDDEDLRDNTTRDAMNKDLTVHLGGPIMQDKVWFYANVGNRKAGYLQGETLNTEEYRNGMIKVTAALTDDISINGMYHYDNYLVNGRFAAYNVAPEATADQDGPNHSFGVELNWFIDANNIFTAKFHGWDGEFGYDGRNGDEPIIQDTTLNYFYNNSPYAYRTMRNRYNLDTRLTSYVDDFHGDHEFKVGANYHTGESEYTFRYDRVLADNGEPYYRYGYYPIESGLEQTKELSAYVTDAWSINEDLTINIGLRYERPSYVIPDQVKSDGTTVPGLDDVHTFNNFAPRLGFVYRFDEDTVIRGSYGWYYEAVATGLLQDLNPGGSPWLEFIWLGGSNFTSDPRSNPGWFEVYREEAGQTHTLDEDLGGQYTEAITLGVERQFWRDYSLAADFVYRRPRDIITQIERGIEYEMVQQVIQGVNYNFYNRVGGSADYLITNADNDVLYSDYTALIFTATKRYSDNWQASASLTLSEYRGIANFDTYGDDSLYLTDPNNQINAEGLLDTHVPWNFKMNGLYTLPFDINVAGFVYFRAGQVWTPVVRTSLNQGSQVNYAAELGSEKLDNYFRTDIRIDKAFTYDRYNFNVMLDIYNLFNSSSETNIENEVQLSDYGEIVGIQSPRRFQLGIRLGF